MATGRHKVLTMGMAKATTAQPNTPDDGLTEFAVWTERDFANDRLIVRKVEPFHPAKHYKGDMSGVIRAKDELDVYRFIESYNP